MTSPPELDVADLVTAPDAEAMIDQLRMGLPVSRQLRAFTVGREEELDDLEGRLDAEPQGQGLLLRANYGSGKTHLLKLTREMALSRGWAVSFVEVSAQHGIRFNRFDQVAGAVLRNLELPDGRRGLRGLFERYEALDTEEVDPDVADEREELSGGGRWDYSDLLSSEALYVGLRAWMRSEDEDVRDLAVEWLSHPDRYQTRRKLLKEQLVDQLFVGDPRSGWQLYAALDWSRDDYENAWRLLNGTNQLVHLTGARGLVLCFDEAEDILQGLNNRNYEATALRFLFDFFVGRFDGEAYFAVTPDFVNKARDLLLMKGVYEFPYSQFDELDNFQLSPLTFDDFLLLASRVVKLHSQAYDWDAGGALDFAAAADVLTREWDPHEPQRIRIAAKELVSLLDEALDG
jgi:hypothetical protein